MTQTTQQQTLKQNRRQLNRLLENFETKLLNEDLRPQVMALIPARQLSGQPSIPGDEALRARSRLLAYFRRYPLQVISSGELKVVAGFQDWKRRVRELRVKFGWSIASGSTISEMGVSDEPQPEQLGFATDKLKPDDHVLLSAEQDKAAPFRWNIARDIRKQELTIREKVLEYLHLNVGAEISGEELRYVAGDKSEWARRVRELRTEEGWPVVSRNTGRPELPVGVYVLEEDRQSPAHDRKIPDTVRAKVLERDGYACRDCGWHQSKWTPALPRHLELHHVLEHAKGGENSVDNLITLCTVCHDERHRITKTV